MSTLIARKVARLVDVVAGLRGRVREVFAAELSKAVAATVRDVLTTMLGGGPVDEWRRPGHDYDPADAWDDPSRPPAPYGSYAAEDDEMPEVPAAPDAGPAAMTASAVTLAAAVGSWLYRRSRSRLCGVAAALAVGLAAAFGGPLTRSVVTAVAAVHQIVGPGDLPAPLE